ncbi:unnamed protein product [Caretta caretta]
MRRTALWNLLFLPTPGLDMQGSYNMGMGWESYFLFTDLFEAADGLVKVQVALGNITSKRERIKILYKKTAPDHAAKLQRLAQIHMQQQAEIPMA